MVNPSLLFLCIRLQVAYQYHLMERRRKAKNAKRFTLRTWRTGAVADALGGY
jgi:hypothetical protein